MAKNSGAVSTLLSFVAWLTGVLVALSVAFGMTGSTRLGQVLTLPVWLGGDAVASLTGWIVIITTILGVVLAIVDRFKK